MPPMANVDLEEPHKGPTKLSPTVWCLDEEAISVEIDNLEPTKISPTVSNLEHPFQSVLSSRRPGVGNKQQKSTRITEVLEDEPSINHLRNAIKSEKTEFNEWVMSTTAIMKVTITSVKDIANKLCELCRFIELANKESVKANSVTSIPSKLGEIGLWFEETVKPESIRFTAAQLQKATKKRKRDTLETRVSNAVKELQKLCLAHEKWKLFQLLCEHVDTNERSTRYRTMIQAIQIQVEANASTNVIMNMLLSMAPLYVEM